MGSSRRAILLSIACVGLLLAGPVAAQDVQKVSFQMMVSHVSPEPGEIDPRARDLHRLLCKEFRCGTLKVLSSKTLDLRLDEIGSVRLPNGGTASVRPIDVARSGVLVAVDLAGAQRAQMDLRVPNGKTVVIGGEPHDGGKLVITLRPSY